MRRIVMLLVPGLAAGLFGADAVGQQTGKNAAKAPASKGVATPAQQPKGASAPAQQPKAAVVDPALQAKLDDVLNEWEVKSAQIKTLDTFFYRKEVSDVLGEVEYFEGRAMLQGPNLAALQSSKIKIEKKDDELFRKAIAARLNPAFKKEDDLISDNMRDFHERIVCSGTSIYRYDGAVRQIFEYPLAKDQQTAMMQQGPLPFLFNMKKADVLKRYAMQLYKEDANKYCIQVVPKLEEDRNAFAQALIYLRKDTFLPEMLILIESNKNQQIYYLAQLQPNVSVNPNNFVHEPKKWPGWPLVQNAPLGQGGGAAPVVPKAAAPKAAAQPAPAAKGQMKR